MASQHLYVNSRTRDNGVPHDFSINVYGVWPGDDSQNIKIEGVSIPYASPNIKNDWNDVITITMTGQFSNSMFALEPLGRFQISTIIKIPQGFWNLSELAFYLDNSPLNSFYEYMDLNSVFTINGVNRTEAEFLSTFDQFGNARLDIVPEYEIGPSFLNAGRYQIDFIYDPASEGSYINVDTVRVFLSNVDDIGKRLFSRLGIPSYIKQHPIDIRGSAFSELEPVYTAWRQRFVDRSPLIPNLQITYVDICTNMSTSCVSNDEALPNVLKRIFIGNTPFGEYLPIESSYEHESILNVDSNSALRLRLWLRSDDGSLFILPHESQVAYHMSITSTSSES
jgi:hypothetical protein